MREGIGLMSVKRRDLDLLIDRGKGYGCKSCNGKLYNLNDSNGKRCNSDGNGKDIVLMIIIGNVIDFIIVLERVYFQ